MVLEVMRIIFGIVLFVLFLAILNFITKILGLLVDYLEKGARFYDYAAQYILHDAEKENALIDEKEKENG